MTIAGGSPATVGHRGIITLCAMVGTLMQALDSTIANVALPYMQGSLSTTYDQITWVLTSYVIAAAIMTAPSGWLANRFGRKNVFLVSVAGFTIASMLCGIAASIEEMVAFRLLQGFFGAALVPLSQATMLDIYPPERRGAAMALWGMGVMIGPIVGPTLGGYLTQAYDWRYVFFINLPFGVLTLAGLALFMPRSVRQPLRFDWTGFLALALALGAFQMMLDRGELLDWFGSYEIITEAILAGLGAYLFLVHMATADNPFIPPVLFRDRNFVAGIIMMFAIGMVLLSSAALLAPYLQNLADFPVDTAGLMMAPRGIGTLFAMMAAGRLTARMDPRPLIGGGVLLISATLWWMTQWTPAVSQMEIVVVTVIMGIGLGFVFVPVQVVSFATLPAMRRNDGTAIYSLLRNVGSAIGISVTSTLLTEMQQFNHAEIARAVTPFNRALTANPTAMHFLDPMTAHGATLLNAAVNYQSSIIAYVDDFQYMMITTLLSFPLVFLMRRPRTINAEAHAAVLD